MTPDQIFAIIMLLQAFGVPQDTIDQVNLDLQPKIVQTVNVAPVVNVGAGNDNYISVPDLAFVQTPTISFVNDNYQINWELTTPASGEIRYSIYQTGIDGEIVDPAYYQGDLGSSKHLADIDSATSTYTVTNKTINGYLLILNSGNQELMWIGRLHK